MLGVRQPLHQPKSRCCWVCCSNSATAASPTSSSLQLLLPASSRPHTSLPRDVLRPSLRSSPRTTVPHFPPNADSREDAHVAVDSATPGRRTKADEAKRASSESMIRLFKTPCREPCEQLGGAVSKSAVGPRDCQDFSLQVPLSSSVFAGPGSTSAPTAHNQLCNNEVVLALVLVWGK